MLPVVVFGFLFFSKVSTWTVDLEKVKNYVIENDVESVENDDIQNIESNSLDENYSSELEYQSNQEKEVSSIIRNGSVYLEGLSKALTSYRVTLNNCTDTGTEEPDVPKEQREGVNICGAAANNSEYVQKLSELALVTTNQLRERASDQVTKDDRNENELLLQLAWLLDRLAYITGYEPNPKQYITEESSTTSTTISTTTTTTTTTEATVKPNPKFESANSLEILEQTENGRSMSKPSQETFRSRRRRSAGPLQEALSYYVKYKVWEGANAANDNIGLDVPNDLTAKPISKRSVGRVSGSRRVKNRMKH